MISNRLRATLLGIALLVSPILVYSAQETILSGTGVYWGDEKDKINSNFDELYGWGDHSLEGYLTEEADPVFSAWDKDYNDLINKPDIPGSLTEGSGIDITGSTISIDPATAPTLNQNTTGTASNVTGTVAVLTGGTGATTAAGARTNLGLAIGTNVQAYDEDLTTYGMIPPSADVQSVLGAASYDAIKTLLDIDDLQTATGISAGTANLGTFTGSTIADSSTIKGALQALETAVEGATGGTLGAAAYLDATNGTIGDVVVWVDDGDGNASIPIDTVSGVGAAAYLDATNGVIGDVVVWVDDGFGTASIPVDTISGVGDAAYLDATNGVIGDVVTWVDDGAGNASIPIGLGDAAFLDATNGTIGDVVVWVDDGDGNAAIPVNVPVDVGDLTDTGGLLTSDTLGDLSCTTNQIAKWNGSAWACAADATAAGAGYTATVPTYSDEACTAGQYAFSTTTGYVCVASGDWNTFALTNWDNPTPSSAPTLTSATVGTLGLYADLLFSEEIFIGAGGNGGWVMDCADTGEIAMTYSSGAESTTLSYELSDTPVEDEVCTVDYTQPGNGLENGDDVDLASITARSVTNNSEVSGVASCTTTVFDYTAETRTGDVDIHDNADLYYVGNFYYEAASRTVCSVTANLSWKAGDITDRSYYAVIYSLDGYDFDTLLATSAAVTGNNSWSQTDVEFTFSSPPTLSANTSYAIAVYVDAAVSSANYAEFNYAAETSGLGRAAWNSTGTNTTSDGSTDMKMKVMAQ